MFSTWQNKFCWSSFGSDNDRDGRQKGHLSYLLKPIDLEIIAKYCFVLAWFGLPFHFELAMNIGKQIDHK